MPGLLLASGSAAWCQSASGPWTVLDPDKAVARNGVELIPQPDGSILASGKNPDTTAYELELDLDLAGITAVRLEALTHDSMKEGGPGRADNGNFVLSEFQVWVAQRGSLSNRREVVFRAAYADRADPTLEAGFAVDGKVTPELGWSPEGQEEHLDREVIFVPARPFGFKSGSRMKVRLSFVSKWPRHAIGRFRLSVTTQAEIDPLLPATPTVTEKEIDLSTRRGIDWLLDHQEPDGSWAGPQANLYHGMTALAAYTLIQCGLRKDHPAIRAALSYMNGRPCYRTYDVGCNLMVYKVLGEPYPGQRIAQLTGHLLETLGNGSTAHGDGWGYPFGHPRGDTSNHIDLSNTQYALLGLRAAAGCGERIPVNVFERMARGLLKEQGEYGSFSYVKGRAPTASMTVAGMTCLAICAEQLDRVKGKQSLARKCRNGITLGEQWLRRNWSVEANLEQPRKANSGENRWLYYYLYGLERVGSLRNTRFLAGHDWHGEGAASIVAKQRADGSWSTAYGELDANTCFALLFLQRGTRTTGREERPTGVDAGTRAAGFEIGSNGENPLVAWVGTLNDPVTARLGRGERVREAVWHLDGVEAARVQPDPDLGVHLQRFTLERELERNGRHEVVARLLFTAADGTATGEEVSSPLMVAVDSVEEEFHRHAQADGQGNQIDMATARLSVSSSHSGNGAGRAADGHGGTSWLCAADDSLPWIQLRMRRPVLSGSLKLIPGHPYPGSPVHWARPRLIAVSINGGREIVSELADSVSRKHVIEFAPTQVRSVRIEIRSVYPGLNQATQAGFAELELFSPEHPRIEPEPTGSTWILPSPAEEGFAEWRFTETGPTGEWTTPDFDDSAWKSARAPFSERHPLEGKGTRWKTQTLWLRREFELEVTATRRLVIEGKIDDTAEIWLNGVLAIEVKSYTVGKYRTLHLEPEAAAVLRPGRNTLAVKVVDSGGSRFFDLILVRR